MSWIYFLLNFLKPHVSTLPNYNSSSFKNILVYILLNWWQTMWKFNSSEMRRWVIGLFCRIIVTSASGFNSVGKAPRETVACMTQVWAITADNGQRRCWAHGGGSERGLGALTARLSLYVRNETNYVEISRYVWSKILNFLIFFKCLDSPSGCVPIRRGFEITLRHTTLGGTPLDKWSSRRRDLYLTTHNIHKGQTSMRPAGFEPTIVASEQPAH
jgi:hypothetical protein